MRGGGDYHSAFHKRASERAVLSLRLGRLVTWRRLYSESSEQHRQTLREVLDGWSA